MCGIIGAFNIKGAATIVEQGLQCIKNRGLDGYGFYDGEKITVQKTVPKIATSSKNIVGHALHAIVNTIAQPIKYKDAVLIANCEIYNWKELSKKHKISAKNDADLLLKLFAKNGVEKSLDELRGVYSFCFWQKNTVTIARDLLGVKPLWYSTTEGLVFASEKKAIEKQVNQVQELNPRHILRYNINSKKLDNTNREFIIIKEFVESEEHAIEHTEQLLADAVNVRIPKRKFGLLFSGGLDSVLIAHYLKKSKRKFTCYVAGVSLSSPDVRFAKQAGRLLGLDVKPVILSDAKIEKYLKTVVPLIEDSNVVKVGVGMALYVACEQAHKDGCKVIFSGNGADEIFAGYARHKGATNLIKDCYSDVLKIYEKNCYRDDVVTMNNALELRVPFLDKPLVEYGLSLSPELRMREDKRRKEFVEKYILRKVAISLVIPTQLAYAKKKAAQYGSGFDKVIEKLTKKNGFLRKSSYLGQFYQKGNARLAALVSSGKDSLYALYTMQRQNYDISCMVTLKSKNKDSYMFHTPTVELVKQQSASLGIPLITQTTDGEKEKELDDLYLALKEAKETHQIEGVVSGALYSTYQRERIERVCDRLGLKIFSPLWHVDQEQYLRDILAKGFRFIITKIAADGLDEKWLGKEITEKDVERLVKLAKKHGINPAGEGGEYESLMIDGPTFSKPLEVNGEKNMESENVGVFVLSKSK